MPAYRDQSATLVDLGEFEPEGYAAQGIHVAWDEGDDEDDEDAEERKTQMMEVPPGAGSVGSLRVLPAVPSAWSPTPPRPRLPSAPFFQPVEAPRQRHWLPEPPPPRVSLPSAGSWNAVAPQPYAQFTAVTEPVPEPLVDPHVAITLATPRAAPKRRGISRKVVLPWPAAVMAAAIGVGVVFEHVQNGDTWSTITSTTDSAHGYVLALVRSTPAR